MSEKGATALDKAAHKLMNYNPKGWSGTTYDDSPKRQFCSWCGQALDWCNTKEVSK